MKSTVLAERQIAGLLKIGQAFLPGDKDFPSFLESRCIEHVDRVVRHIPHQDLPDLKMVLGLFAVLPQFLTTLIMKVLEFLWENNLPMGSIPRQLRLGLRGIVFSLYYCTEESHRKLGYQVGVFFDVNTRP